MRKLVDIIVAEEHGGCKGVWSLSGEVRFLAGLREPYLKKGLKRKFPLDRAV